jgi:uncharacterized protein (TIGR00369 family)
MDFPLRIPFVDELGLQLLRMADGEAELACPVQDRHLNSFRVVHGGVMMTMLDVAMAHAARATLAPAEAAQTGALTVEMKTSFLRPGEGTRLRCTARVLHRTVTMAFCEASVLLEGEGEVLAAHATGTFKFMRAVAGRERRIRPVQPAP